MATGMKALDRYRGKIEDDPLPTPTETHKRVAEFLDELFSTMLGSRTAMGPIVKTIHRMMPALMRDMATVPEAEVCRFMTDLGRRMLLIGGVEPWTVDKCPTEGCPLFVGSICDECADPRD